MELHKGTDKIPQRDEMLRSGLLKRHNDSYVLQENKLFSSVSAAASVVLGRRANGWIEWKNQEGNRLKLNFTKANLPKMKTKNSK